MTIEKDFFRPVMGRFATGVTVVTTCVHESLVGLTVNSLCSVSLDPPLVLVCIDLKSSTVAFFRESGMFVANILSNQQEHLSRCFATPSQDRYEHFCHASAYIAATGAPVIDGVLAFIVTRIVGEYPGGDHVIFVGHVEAMGIGSQVAFQDDTEEQHPNLAKYNGNSGTTDDKVDPLVFYSGQYRHLAHGYQKPSLVAHNDEQGYVVVK